MGSKVRNAALVLALVGASCGGNPSKHATTSAADEVAVEIQPAPDVMTPPLPFESFLPAANPTWPKQNYGGDGVLAPTSPMCGVTNSWGPPRCSREDDPEGGLLEALELGGLDRDERLRHLEACDLPPHFVLLLRAESFRECSAEIANLRSAAGQLPDEVQALLHAFVFASRVDRFVKGTESAVGPIDPIRAERYAELEAKPWLQERLRWLEAQDTVPSEFASGSYPQAVALWALGEAWVRLLGAARIRGATATPELRQDYELRTRFYASLEALVAPVRSQANATFRRTLEALSYQGVVRPPGGEHWLEDAVARLIERKPGAVALFRVLPPRLALAERPGVRQRLFERLPPHLAVRLLKDDEPIDPATMASLSSRGFAPELRRRLGAEDGLDAHWALAQLRLRLGLLSHDRRQFEWAHSHLQRLVQLGGTDAAVATNTTVLLALVDVLRRGPEDASAWLSGNGLPFVTDALLSLPDSVPDLDRNVALVNHFELTWAGGNSAVEPLAKATETVRPLVSALAGTPYGCALEDSFDQKGLWGPMRGGPEARCDELRVQAELDPPGKPLFTRCRPLAWQDQRRMETPTPLDEHCPVGRKRGLRSRAAR